MNTTTTLNDYQKDLLNKLEVSISKTHKVRANIKVSLIHPRNCLYMNTSSKATKDENHHLWYDQSTNQWSWQVTYCKGFNSKRIPIRLSTQDVVVARKMRDLLYHTKELNECIYNSYKNKDLKRHSKLKVLASLIASGNYDLTSIIEIFKL
jgi:hypothetical protein